jgi:predicted transcriptional regulator
MQQENDNAMMTLVASVAGSYLNHNHVSISEIPSVIETISKSLSGLTVVAAPAPVEEAKKEPSVSIKKSVTPDYLIDLFSGRKFKSLKRHLRTEHNMTPDQYRAYWGLPRDYPMTAPNYAATRSELAKKIGLGRASGVGRGGAAVPAAPAAAPAPKAPKAKRAAPKAKAPASTPAPAPEAKAETAEA